MAKQVITKVLSDLDGGEGAETHMFTVDGVEYEVDLTPKQATDFHESLARYAEAGRRLLGSSGGRPSGATPDERERKKALREWAKDNGVRVAPRGRIAASAWDAYAGRHLSPTRPSGKGSKSAKGRGASKR